MKHQSFGEWLFERRTSFGMTQDVLARLAATTKQYVSNIEKGKQHPVTGAYPRPSVKKVDALAHALGVPISEARRAAGYVPDDEQRDIGAARLLSYYRELPTDIKIHLETIAEALWRKSRKSQKRDEAA